MTVLGAGTLTKTGYTFSNWNTAADGSGTSYSPAATFNILANTTLFAQWTINTYTVSYDANGGTGTQTDPNSPYNFGSTVTVLGTGSIVRTGYTFANWNTAADGSGTSYSPAATFSITANTTLYAQWTINTYTVTYNGNANTGGTAPVDPNSPYTYNSTVTVLGPGTLTKTGLHFLALEHGGRWQWHELQPGGDLRITANTTLYAQWTAASSNADLSNLTASAGPLTPAFASGTFAYTLSVPFATTSTTVTPTAADVNATIQVRINGGIYAPVISGTPSGSLALNVGPNTIDVKVLAQNEMRPGGTDVPETIQIYTITVIRAGNVNVNPGAGTFATVKDAFDAINLGTHTGAITVDIVGDTTEAASAVLNASGTGSSSYSSVLVRPVGARTVSGTLAAALIDLNGADFVTINGLNSGGNSLTISNASTVTTAGTSTVRLINGAQNNLITNCNIRGSSTGGTGAATGNVLISTSTGGANSGNTISNNDLGPAGSNLPSKCVMSLGSASPNNNTGNIITNNNIFDFFTAGASCAGISISTNSDLTTISNNRIYQTAPRVFTGAFTYNGMLVSPGAAGSATITGNVIGFGAADGSGTTTISGSTNRINGIAAPSTSTGVTTSIQNNTISGFVQTTSQGTTSTATAFIGISVGATAGSFNIGGTTGNTIGSLDGSTSIVLNNTTVTNNTWGFCGIFDFSFQNLDVISNNKMGTITINNGGTGTGAGFRGIRNAQTTVLTPRSTTTPLVARPRDRSRTMLSAPTTSTELTMPAPTSPAPAT